MIRVSAPRDWSTGWFELRAFLANWAAAAFIDGVDRPLPVLYAANGRENNAKLMLARSCNPHILLPWIARRVWDAAITI